MIVFIGFHYLIGSDERLCIYFPAFVGGLIIPNDVNIEDKISTKNLIEGMCLFFVGCVITYYYKLWLLHLPSMIGGFVVICVFAKFLTKVSLLRKVLNFISYGSMISYLYHRFYFGVFLATFGKLNCAIEYCLFYPLFLVLCFYAQKFYDELIRCLKKRRIC